ncbi:MAG: exodeoxyribonuclease I [Pseudohongiella sp.]|nr:exodeoxyribonuclease I [Pseudohongiella sp.]
MTTSIYWHDYEAWGADPRQDRASQFAGVRTDPDLNEIDAPLMIYCQSPVDRLPHPKACLITGITPQYAQSHGLPEAEFVRLIHDQFSKPQTCVAGYNNIRFDDELSRQLLYRNFYDPYEREWKNGNSRWDIIDMVRLCHAVRPEGINWPRLDDGSPVFRLELLSRSNNLVHADAHDALSDVRATIALAKMVKEAQPKLYDFVFDLRSKHRVHALINLQEQKPLLHISAIYPAKNSCVALVMPLAAHPLESNGVLMFNLGIDPSPWLDMSAEQLQQRLFVAQTDLPEGESRLPVNVLHSNRCPVIAPLSVLDVEKQQSLGIDTAKARRHWELIRSNKNFVQSLVLAYRNKTGTRENGTDPDNMLYGGGFFADADKRLMTQLRQMSGSELAGQFDNLCAQGRDPRLPEMLFRYRARNFPATLSAEELQRWKLFCIQQCLNSGEDCGVTSIKPSQLNLPGCRLLIKQERELNPDASSQHILDELEQWLQTLQQWSGVV